MDEPAVTTVREEGADEDDEESYASASALQRNLAAEIDVEEQEQQKIEGSLFELDDLPPTERDARRTSQHFDEIDDARKQLLATTPKRSISQKHGPVKSSMNLKQVVIGGRKITVAANKGSSHVTAPRLWNKEQRSGLGPKERSTFYEKAIRYVLPKSNKLSVRPTKTKADDELKHAVQLRSQLTTVQEHMYAMDIDDVFTIVKPVSVGTTGQIESTSYDLLRDYGKLDPQIVALSNVWYSEWVQEKYVHENLSITQQFLKLNTDDTLWNKALEDMQDYPHSAHGGPLMFVLIMRRIQDSSAMAIDHVLKQIRNLKISDILGEDVDEAVSMIRSVYNLMLNTSTERHNYVPDDFPRTVLTIFQTSSVAEFNKIFEDEERDVIRQSYKQNGRLEFPTVQATLLLASNLYHGMQSKWNTGKRGAAFNANHNQEHRPKGTCFNCGGDHMLTDCTKPRYDSKIAKARQAFLDKRKQHRSHAGPKGRHPKHKTAKDGTPLIRNRNGAYVVDQKKKKALTAGTDDDKSKSSAKPEDLQLVLNAMNDNAAKLVDDTVKSTVRALLQRDPLDDASTIATQTTAATTATGATFYDSAAILAALNRS